MLDVISPAFAQNGAPQGGGGWETLIFMLMMFAIFYFLLIRPQQKQQKTHREMIANLKRGDSVVTGGGLLARVHRVDDDILVLDLGEVEVGNKSFKPVRVRVRKNTITAITAKAGGAVTSEADKDDGGTAEPKVDLKK
ncbi:MAG: preprotein translocase subunit YajC [Magnetococcales bacterium]|nr:preprotein translocase subunit YajC [Magnetococcales bacterium]